MAFFVVKSSGLSLSALVAIFLLILSFVVFVHFGGCCDSYLLYLFALALAPARGRVEPMDIHRNRAIDYLGISQNVEFMKKLIDAL